MVRISIILLLGRWLDLYLMVTPPVVGAESSLGLVEVGLLIGGTGAMFMMFFRMFRRAAPIPINDPRLQDSLHHHQ